MISQIFQLLPPNAGVTRIEYEGPRIAIYTSNLSFFMDNPRVIPDIVNMLKKHVIVKSDQARREEEENTRERLSKIIPKEAEVTGMFFDGIQGELVIEVKDPSKLEGEVKEKIEMLAEEIGWKIKVRRNIAQQPQTYQLVNHTLKSSEDERLAFLRTVGSRIFREKITNKRDLLVTFLGAAGEVGRSSILVSTNESKVLLDCGINLGVSEKSDAFPRFDLAGLNLDELDAVVISHAHLDHSGFVPMLYKYGYDGPTYCTEPTLTLITLLLNDMIKVADAEGKKLFFDGQNLKDFINHCITIPYSSVTDIAPDVKLTFSNAGHILGSATVHLHIGQGLYNLVYTGDYKFDKSRLFQPANYIYPRIEALITESTYGLRDDIMPPRVTAEETLISAINSTVKDGGKVLIPIPAVGRAQEILLVLNEYIAQGKMEKVPIFVEGMINEATKIHLLYPEFMNKEIRDRIIYQGENPFITENFTVIAHPKDREEVFSSGPAVILATSGMLEGGPSVIYFRELAQDNKNRVIFVSYQVAGTMGRRVLDGAKEIGVQDDGGKLRMVQVNASVSRIEGFSGHSDYNQLINFISRFRGKVQRVMVVHGERTKVQSLAESVNRLYHRNIAETPEVGETIRLY